MPRLLLLSCLLLFLQSSFAQEFVATSNARQVVKGTTFTVTFEVNQSDAQGFTPPNFNPFKVIGGPNRSVSTSIINGRRSSRYSMSYSLMATQTGKFTIPGALISVKNRKLRSNSIPIEVVEASSATTGNDIMVKVELDRDSLYVGQQVVLSLKIYTTVTVQRYDVLLMPEFNDIFVKELPRYNRQGKLEVIDGVQYQTQILKRMALFPQKSGHYKFDGMVVRLGIPTNQRRQSGFFFNTEIKTREVVTEPFEFEVERLPIPQPSSFSGGVGKYEVKFQSDRTRLSTDDALTLTMTVRGDGDSRLLMPPDLDLGPDFDTYDANVIKTEEQPAEDRNRFGKLFEYLVIPKTPGKLPLIPKFSYFSADSDAYVTLAPDTILLDVRKGNTEAKALDRFKKDQKLELRSIVHQWGPVGKNHFWIKSPIYWTLWALIALTLVVLLLWRRRQLQIAGMDPSVLKYRRAQKVAEKRLTEAKRLLNAGEDKAFFEEVALATKQYLGDKLRVDQSQFSRKTISTALEGLHAGDDLKAKVIQLLNDCDLAIFASTFAPDKEAVYSRAIQVVTDLEKSLEK